MFSTHLKNVFDGCREEQVDHNLSLLQTSKLAVQSKDALVQSGRMVYAASNATLQVALQRGRYVSLLHVKPQPIGASGIHASYIAYSEWQQTV